MPKLAAKECIRMFQVRVWAWLLGFLHKIGVTNSIVSELRVLVGLEFAWSLGIRRLIVESKSKITCCVIVKTDKF